MKVGDAVVTLWRGNPTKGRISEVIRKGYYRVTLATGEVCCRSETDLSRGTASDRRTVTQKNKEENMKELDRLYIIVGRIGTGKNYLMEKILEKVPTIKAVKFYTTDPGAGDMYEYMSPEEARTVTNKLLRKVEDGYESFTTPQLVAEGDVCIASPAGLKEICTALPETAVMLIHVRADRKPAKGFAVADVADSEAAKSIFNKKAALEEDEFAAFEAEFGQGGISGCVPLHYDILNEFWENCMDGYVDDLARLERKVRNAFAMIQVLKAAGNLYMCHGKTRVVAKESASAPVKLRYLSDIQLAYEMLGNPDGLGDAMLDAFLDIEGLDLTAAAATNTKVVYCYRDASNYKMEQSAVIKGTMSPEMTEEIAGCLADGEYFIPSQVGLPEKRFEEVTEDDHCWFEGLTLKATKEEPTVGMTAYELYRNFKKARGNWEEHLPLCE